MFSVNWLKSQATPPKTYKCGYCSKEVGSDKGYNSGSSSITIYICPICTNPTYFGEKLRQIPAPTFGRNVEGITDEGIEFHYNEARNCTSVGAYTAAALICRKILMNLGVFKGAKEGLYFENYVDYLNDKGYIPPDARDWVDAIRKTGNKATHKLPSIEKDDAEDILYFVQYLLIFIFELKTKKERVTGPKS